MRKDYECIKRKNKKFTGKEKKETQELKAYETKEKERKRREISNQKIGVCIRRKDKELSKTEWRNATWASEREGKGHGD